MNRDAGYVHRRLQDVVPTGIYECNKNCACAQNCQNRLVQFPIRSRLQIFKTSNRGWGIRALDDMPQGAFICTYVGKLYGPEEGNAQGTAFGDMYFADLDMIDNIERRKEGYESEVSDEGIEDDASDGESDEEAVKKKKENKEKEENTDDEVKKQEEPSEEMKVDETDLNKEDEPKPADKTTPPASSGSGANTGFKSVRKYFGEDEDIYIMDAMTQGNIGRYLNHSCDPNVFVQNVFVNSHDLR